MNVICSLIAQVRSSIYVTGLALGALLSVVPVTATYADGHDCKNETCAFIGPIPSIVQLDSGGEFVGLMHIFTAPDSKGLEGRPTTDYSSSYFALYLDVPLEVVDERGCIVYRLSVMQVRFSSEEVRRYAEALATKYVRLNGRIVESELAAEKTYVVLYVTGIREETFAFKTPLEK
jgi:hypothetical protein